MKGWKTWTGAILLGISQILGTIWPDLAGPLTQIVDGIGGVLVIIGIGHKIEKSKP